MSQKQKLYTAAGIRETLRKIEDTLKQIEAREGEADGICDCPGYNPWLHLETCKQMLTRWKADLEKQLRSKEKWAEFYKGLRESGADRG